MDMQYSEAIKTQAALPNKIIDEIRIFSKICDPPNDLQMISSIVSASSSLTSPVDSGVQLLDSESDVLSVMSMSGTACDIDSNLLTETKEMERSNTTEQLSDTNKVSENNPDYLKLTIDKEIILANLQQNIMTKSDIANQNVTPCNNFVVYSSSAPNIDYKNIETKNNIQDSEKGEEKQDIDKTIADSTDVLGTDLHVSVSEEVKEDQNVINQENNQIASTPADEQIVFRRQRKKKSSKSDTPKKRVSFHEDILNNTKTDDIHINHGFITHQPDISMSFFNWDSIPKRDVVKGM